MDDEIKRVGNTSESTSEYEIISDNGSTIDWSTVRNISSGDINSNSPKIKMIEANKFEELATAKYAVQQEEVQKWITHLEHGLIQTGLEFSKTNTKLQNRVDLLVADLENVKVEAKRLSDEAKITRKSAAAEKEGLFYELARTKSELDQATVRNSHITKTAESLAYQNYELTNKLREFKLREEASLNDILKLKQENVALQKELHSLESAKVDLKNYMEQAARRFSEEAERMRARLEEETKLKNSAKKMENISLHEERTKSGQLESDQATAKNELQAAREPPCPDQILLAVGGWDLDSELAGSIEAYDPNKQSWTKLLNISDPNGPRTGHGCVMLNQEMWTIGGYSGGDRNSVNSVRKLNLVTKEWSECAPMNHSRRDLSVVHHNGLIWAIGGWDGGRERKTAERYDPTDSKWSFISPLSVPRSSAHATVCSDKIYIAGGSESGNNSLDSVEYYDAATDRWICLTAPMKHRRRGFGCASLDGVIYIVGGENAPNKILSSAERYDPRTGRWDQLSDMATGRTRFGIECVAGKIVVAGGLNGNTEVIAECEEYEPRTNSWAPLAPMNEERYWLCCVAVERTDVEPYF